MAGGKRGVDSERNAGQKDSVTLESGRQEAGQSEGITGKKETSVLVGSRLSNQGSGADFF